jgi:glycosyltransferase domain-containing protein
MMKFDSKITILIPTRNRSHFLNRALMYYSQKNFRCFFIIGDSSTDLEEKNNTEKVCDLYKQDLNIKYVYYAQDIRFGDKLSEMCSLSNNTYTSIIGDDDFIVYQGLVECCKFLDANNDTVGVYGERLGIMMMDYPNDSKNWYASRQFRFKNIIGKDFKERINILETPSWSQHIYSLYRTDVIKNSLNSIKGLDYSSSNEYLLYMSVAISGNWIKLDNLFAICSFETDVFQYRDRNSFPHYWGIVGSKLKQLSQLNFSKDLSIAVENISKVYENKIDKENLKEELLRCFWLKNSLFLSKNLVSSGRNKSYFKLSKLSKLVLNYNIMVFLFNFIKAIFTKIFWILIFDKNKSFGIYQKKQSNFTFLLTTILHFSNLKYTLKNLEDKNHSYHDDFMDVFMLWLKFPMGKKLDK